MLEEPRSYIGVWWLPTNPDLKLTGTLTLSEEEFALEVVGNFEQVGHVFLFDFKDQPRIIGTTTNNEVVTLESNMAIGHNPRSPGPVTTRYSPSVVLIGPATWSDLTDVIEFDEIQVGFTDLSTWVAASAIQHGPPKLAEDGKSFARFDVSLVPLDPFVYPLANGQQVRISFSFSSSGLSAVPTSVVLSQTARLGLRFAKPAVMAEIYDALYQLRNFLTFAVGRPARVLDVRGIIDAEHVETEPGRPEVPVEMDMLWRFANVEPPTRELMDHRMLFTRAAAQDRLGDVFNAWWEKEPVLKPVFDLYFGTITSGLVAGHVRFLTFAQALETYHRRTRNRTPLSIAEFKERRGALISAAPSKELGLWLGEKLAFANELALRDRLREIAEICPAATAKIVGQDVDGFVTLSVDTRNYRTHYTSKLEKKAASGIRLGRLTHQLQALIETVLLHELGFTCDEVVGMLDRARRFELIENFRTAETSDDDGGGG